MASLGSDPSIYAQVGQGVPQPANMLTGFGQVAQTGNALIGLQNAQKLMAARQAIGQNVQAATDPNTGAVDTGKLNVLNAQTPAAAYGAQDSATTNQALQSSQQTQAHQGQSQVNGQLAAMLTDKSQWNAQSAQQSIQSLLHSGAITPQNAQSAVADLPPPGSPAAAYGAYYYRHAAANLTSPDAIQQAFGTNTTTNVGNSILQGVTASPAQGGGTKYVTSTDMGTSPEFRLGQTQTGFDQNTLAPLMGTTSQLVQKQGMNPVTGQPLGDGRYPSVPQGLRGPNATPAPASSANTAPQASSNGVQVTPGPLDVANRNQQVAANNDMFKQIGSDAQDAQQQNAVLGNMLGDSTLFSTGPTKINDFKKGITKYAPALSRMLGVDPTAVAANESFDKLGAQLALKQGAGSDGRLGVAETANPSSHLSKFGSDLIIRQLQGNADYKQALGKMAGQQSSTDPNMSPAKFQSNVASNLDPRAFQIARMTPVQQKTYFNSLSPTDQQLVDNAFTYATQNHLLP